MGDNFEGPIKSAQGENFEKIFFRNFSKNFESFQKYILGIVRPRSRSEIDFLEKKSEKVANTGTPPPFSYMRDMKIRSLGKIYQNAPMPPSQKLKFSIILIKKNEPAHMKTPFWGKISEKKFGKRLRFSIILMKRSPPHMKIGFLAIFCQVFGKKLDFRLF